MPATPPIDLSTYPLDDDARIAATVAACRAQLGRDQYCSLPGFLLPAAVEETAALVQSLRGEANPAKSMRNCYLQRAGDPGLPDDHPRNIMMPASYRMIAADCFSESTALRALYNWTPFQRFVADVVGEDQVFPSADRLQPVNVICYGEGDQSAWHYDSTNAFTMTLMLQAPFEGGAFELAANTRNSPENEDIPYMQDVLAGRSGRIRRVGRSPGELTIFRGCNSLHRVAPVKGPRDRLMAVFVYEDRPGVVGDPEVNLTVYGRSG